MSTTRIATPNQLADELRRLLAYCKTGNPSREKLAHALVVLVDRVALINPKNKDIEPGLRGIATRMEQAVANFIEVLMKQGGISKVEAEKVYQTYRKMKIVKMDAVNGRIDVKHGGFLDRDVIRRALQGES